jgi:hypothetical protein
MYYYYDDLSQYSVWLQTVRPGDRGSIPGRVERDFSCSLCVQTGSRAHPASCTMGTGGPFPGAKRGRGVTLMTHPIWCRGQEWVEIYLLSLQAPSWHVVRLHYYYYYSTTA